jgi:hypothetical protein
MVSLLPFHDFTYDQREMIYELMGRKYRLGV